MGNDKTHIKSRQTPLQESASGLIHSVACSKRRPRGRAFIVVEHLTAARQMDLSKPAAIAVAHKEFGALTVTFDQSAGKMNVEIAAENQESQRRLGFPDYSAQDSAHGPHTVYITEKVCLQVKCK